MRNKCYNGQNIRKKRTSVAILASSFFPWREQFALSAASENSRPAKSGRALRFSRYVYSRGSVGKVLRAVRKRFVTARFHAGRPQSQTRNEPYESTAHSIARPIDGRHVSWISVANRELRKPAARGEIGVGFVLKFLPVQRRGRCFICRLFGLERVVRLNGYFVYFCFSMCALLLAVASKELRKRCSLKKHTHMPVYVHINTFY